MNYNQLNSYKNLLKIGCKEVTGPKQKLEGIVRFSIDENEFVYWPISGIIKKRYNIRNVAENHIEKGISEENYDIAFSLIYFMIKNFTKSSNKSFSLENINFNDEYGENAKRFFIKFIFKENK